MATSDFFFLGTYSTSVWWRQLLISHSNIVKTEVKTFNAYKH